MGRARLGDYLLGIQGLALIRTWMTSDPTASAKRIDEIAHLHAGLNDGLPSVVLDLPELEVGPGYEAWAGTYDELPNPLISLEEPLVHALVDSLPPGRALDAACGTGRHTEYLHSRGHAVIGVRDQKLPSGQMIRFGMLLAGGATGRVDKGWANIAARALGPQQAMPERTLTNHWKRSCSWDCPPNGRWSLYSVSSFRSVSQIRMDPLSIFYAN